MATLKETSEEQYKELLTEIYGTVKFGCLEFDAGEIIKELDPTAFRCGMADEAEVWLCDDCDTAHDTEAEANKCCDSENQ